jgi:hypothetical protein
MRMGRICRRASFLGAYTSDIRREENMTSTAEKVFDRSTHSTRPARTHNINIRINMMGLKYFWTVALSFALLAVTARADVLIEVDVNGKIDDPGSKQGSILHRLLSLVETTRISSDVQPEVEVTDRTRRMKKGKGGKGRRRSFNSASSEDSGDDDDDDAVDDDEVEESGSGSAKDSKDSKASKSSKGSKSAKVRETNPVTGRNER